jgi:glycosyltransferase involved in cell wall biosynthesis
MDLALPTAEIDLRHEPASPLLTVVLVCTQRNWHGGEEQAALLATGLRWHGHRVKILARQSSEFARGMAARGFDVAQFPGHGRSPRGVWQIRHWLRHWQPDVLHYNDPHALTSAGLASLGLPIPLRVASRRVDFPLKSLLRYRGLSDIVICVSQAVKGVCQSAGLDEQRLYVVADGVDPSRMQQGVRARGRQLFRVNDQTVLLLTVAKLTDHKGHRYMLDAMPRIVAQRPDVVWAVVGDGSLRDSLHWHARRLGMQNNVQFLGYRRDIPDLMAAADLLVVPSHMEGLCSTIVDAMLAGTPVVATRAGGIPDLLAESDDLGPATGWLVPPRDSLALAEAVLDALRYPHVTARLRDTALQRAASQFTAARMVERTLDVYRSALAARAVMDSSCCGVRPEHFCQSRACLRNE